MKRNNGPPSSGRNGPSNDGHKKRPLAGGLWGDKTNGRGYCHIPPYDSRKCQPLQDSAFADFNLPLSLLIDQSVDLVEKHDQQAHYHEQEAEFHRNRANAHRQVLVELQRLIPTRVSQKSNSHTQIYPHKDGRK